MSLKPVRQRNSKKREPFNSTHKRTKKVELFNVRILLLFATHFSGHNFRFKKSSVSVFCKELTTKILKFTFNCFRDLEIKR